MTRVLLISPESTDGDVAAHASAIGSIPHVEVTRRPAPAEDRLAFVLRCAAQLFRHDRHDDIVVTVGPAAMAAAYIGWRGPTVHIPVGRLTAPEARFCGRLARRGTFRLVTSSESIATAAKREVINTDHVALIRPCSSDTTLPSAPLAASRTASREKLAISNDTPLVYLPGISRFGSNHRLALWAANILYFRDPRVRVLTVGGGTQAGFVRRFITSAEMWPAIVDGNVLTEAERAAAADVAICAADGAPDIAPLATLTRSGTPIAGIARTWAREELSAYPARLADGTKARLLARAALEAMERGRTTPPAGMTTESAGRQWFALLRSFARSS